MRIEFLSADDARWDKVIKGLWHDIYHKLDYVTLEAARTEGEPEAFLLIDDDRVFFAPYLVRSCQNVAPDDPAAANRRDIVSPYGYPGPLLSDAARKTEGFAVHALKTFFAALAERSVCSAFFRLHPILNENAAETFRHEALTVSGATVSMDLTLSEDDLWSAIKRDRRRVIRKGREAGMVAKVGSVEDYLDALSDIQDETMKRVGASDAYFTFDRDYFRDFDRRMPGAISVCIVEIDGRIACAGLYTECGGVVQSALGGTLDEFVRLSPSSLETHHMALWSKERGNRFLHLGGGLGSKGDHLFSYKASFSKSVHDFCTIRKIIHQDNYRELVDARARHLRTDAVALAQSSYFPAYRGGA